MNDEDAFRERLAAMTPQQVAALYDATADDWAALGITREIFTHNMSAKADYDAEVRPFELLFDAYLALADEPVRAAARAYQAGLEDLDRPAHRDRPLGDVQDDADRLRHAFDAAIAASGDQRLIEAKRLYDQAVVTASDRFASRLR